MDLPDFDLAGEGPSNRHPYYGLIQVGCPDDCAVCGEKSTGHHYDVPSCNGCKTFFRRTILSQKKYHCSRGGRCFEILPKEHRCLCRSCRYDRCVQTGMNPLAIVTDDDLSDNALVKKVLAKRKQMVYRRKSDEDVVPPKTFRALVLCEDYADTYIKYLLYLETKYEHIRASEYNPRSDSDMDLESLLKAPSSLGLNYKEMPGWPLNNEPSSHKIQIPLELHVKHRIPLPPIKTETMPANYKEWLYVDIIYAIDYVKTFDFFHKLRHTDQVIFLKHVALLCSCMMASFYSYEKKSTIMMFPDGRTPFRRHEQFTKSKSPWHTIKHMRKLGLDKSEYVLLKAILVCNATMDKLSAEARAIILPEKEKYAKSLMSYVLARRGPELAPTFYVDCMALIETTYRQVQRAREMNVLLQALNLKIRSKLAVEVDAIY